MKIVVEADFLRNSYIEVIQSFYIAGYHTFTIFPSRRECIIKLIRHFKLASARGSFRRLYLILAVSVSNFSFGDRDCSGSVSIVGVELSKK